MASADGFEFRDPRTGKTYTITTITPDDLRPADPVIVCVSDVIAAIDKGDRWFLVRLDTGELTIAHPRLVAGRAQWILVEEDFWGSLRLAANGMPERIETIECPICAVLFDVMWDCSKTLADVRAICPKCGHCVYELPDNVADVQGDDDGGLAQR